jgi:glycine C-acetyltransferase|tara:strand:+ start:265 stop:1446 length:1182 start_codon:yes stop_codon:yes gene_type:complete
MKKINEILDKELNEIHKAGLYKKEREIESAQSDIIKVNGKNVINFCANNYLGLSNHPLIIESAKKALDKWGFGLSSVRFICGTQNIHKELENTISKFLSKEDTILYTSCFDANGGLFETLFNDNDIIISDSLNHASIIDGVKLCKAKKAVFPNSNMYELEQILINNQNARQRIITTDGVFSMDGYIAKLDEICSLAQKYNALVHVDDSHATGFVGDTGRGSVEYCNVIDNVDIITSTFGKALGGASGGFTSASKNVISMLRQRSRPYLFSNSLAPSIVSASIQAVSLIESDKSILNTLKSNTLYFREQIVDAGFTIKDGNHPIVPIMLGDANLAQNLSQLMLEKGIYVIGFSFPVVPKGEARIRVQISAAHSIAQIDEAVKAFKECGMKLKII